MVPAQTVHFIDTGQLELYNYYTLQLQILKILSTTALSRVLLTVKPGLMDLTDTLARKLLFFHV